MSIMVKFELSVQSNKVAEFKQFFERILQGTRDFSGNEGAKIAYCAEDETKVVLIEYWKSKEDFDHYLNWRKDIGDFDTLGSMLAVEPDIQSFTVLKNA
jgi:quinol monooxygenase YgiN